MKAKAAILTVGIALLGTAAYADVYVTAMAQNSGTAYLYNPDDGSVYTSASFTSGSATLSTAGLSVLDKYAVTLSYDGSTPPWRSDVYWANGGGSVVGYKTWAGSGDDYVTALAGTISDRRFSSISGGYSIQMTMSANGNLNAYTNDTYELDANILVYRPSASVADVAASSTISKTWDSSTLGGVYSHTTAASSITGYDVITVYSNGNFWAEYLGEDQGGGVYSLSFAAAIDPGGSAYNTPGAITDAGGGKVTFTSEATSALVLSDLTPYYVMMEAAWMYDTLGNYTLMPDDAGVSLTNPDHYVIPEPAVVTLIGSVGIVMLFGRRIFKS